MWERVCDGPLLCGGKWLAIPALVGRSITVDVASHVPVEVVPV